VAYQLLILYLAETTRLFYEMNVARGVHALQLAITGWAVVGIWRSSGNSIERARIEMRFPLWASRP
jgi:hypothetical protein